MQTMISRITHESTKLCGKNKRVANSFLTLMRFLFASNVLLSFAVNFVHQSFPPLAEQGA